MSDLTPFAFAVIPVLLSVGCLFWSRRARPRIRYDGTEEPKTTFVARRWLLVFEGIGGLTLSAVGAASFIWNEPPLLLNLMIYNLFAILIVPVVVTILYPGVMSGRY